MISDSFEFEFEESGAGVGNPDLISVETCGEFVCRPSYFFAIFVNKKPRKGTLRGWA